MAKKLLAAQLNASHTRDRLSHVFWRTLNGLVL